MTIIMFVLSSFFEFLGELVAEYPVKGKKLSLLKYLISYVLTCNKCSTWWITLLFTFNPVVAALTALNVMLLKHFESKYFPTVLGS